MKIILTILFLSVFAFGQADSKKKFDKNACDVLSNEYLAEKMNWNAKMIKKDETKFRRASVCTINHGEENMLVRIGEKSEKAIARKSLEKQYAGFLKNGEEGLKYMEIDSDENTQILYAAGEEKFGFTTFIARKRFGNERNFRVEIRSKTRNENDAKALVLEMVEKGNSLN